MSGEQYLGDSGVASFSGSDEPPGRVNVQLNSALLQINMQHMLFSRVWISPPLIMRLRVLHSTVLKRQVSPEELQTPGGPFLKKTFTVSSDRFWSMQTSTGAETRIKSNTLTTPTARFTH